MDVEAKDSFQTNKAMITDQAMFICAFTFFAGSSDSKRYQLFDRTFFPLFIVWEVGVVVLAEKGETSVADPQSARPHCPPNSSPSGGLAAGGRLLSLASVRVYAGG